MFEIHLWISCESHSLLRFLLLPPTYGKQKKMVRHCPSPIPEPTYTFHGKKMPLFGGWGYFCLFGD